jgi:hypothetical protein
MKKAQRLYWYKTKSVRCSKTMFLSTWHYKLQLTGNVLPSSGLVRQHLLCVLCCPGEVGLVLAAVKWAMRFPIPSRQMTLQDIWRQLYFESRSGGGFRGANVKRGRNGLQLIPVLLQLEIVFDTWIKFSDVVWYNVSCCVHLWNRYPSDVSRYDPVCQTRWGSMDLTTRPRIAACDCNTNNKPRVAKSVFSIRSLVDVKEEASDVHSNRPVGELQS